MIWLNTVMYGGWALYRFGGAKWLLVTIPVAWGTAWYFSRQDPHVAPLESAQSATPPGHAHDQDTGREDRR